MVIEVKIPPMGESITSGVIANWRVKDGDTVKRDQPLYELETDKITSEGVAEGEGVIRLKVEAGAEVMIGDIIATIDPAGGAGAPPEGATPAESRRKAQSAGETEVSPRETSDKLEAPGADTGNGSMAVPMSESPAVRRIAAESGIDPETVKGTGKGGRVTKGDMLKAVEDFRKEEATAAPGQQPPGTGEKKETSAEPREDRTTRRRLSPLRLRIAERLVQVKNETAMLTTFNEVDMTAVRELRARYQDDFTKRNGIKLGFMSFFVKAVVHALQQVPGINARIDGDFVVENRFFDIGVAVSTDRGLMVPVIRDCDTKSFAAIEKDIGDYAKKAREGKVTLDDLAGGVFTITNGGIFGSLLSTPIINPPQSAILGMHTIQDRPVALNGAVVIRPMMYLALSYDHRIVDGREAVTFLVTMKQVLEDPARMLLQV